MFWGSTNLVGFHPSPNEYSKERKMIACFIKSLMPLSTIFHPYRGGPFSLVEEAEVPGETKRPWAGNSHPYHVESESNATFLCCKKSDANTCYVGNNPQCPVQVSVHQLLVPRPLAIQTRNSKKTNVVLDVQRTNGNSPKFY